MAKGRTYEIVRLEGGMPFTEEYYNFHTTRRRVGKEDRIWLAIGEAELRKHRRPTMVIVKAGQIFSLGEGGTPEEAIAKAFAAHEARCGRRRKSRHNVAVINFAPRVLHKVAIAKCGVDVLFTTVLEKQGWSDVEEQFKKSWLGYPKHDESRAFIEPRWDWRTRKAKQVKTPAE